jgi:hypothetical protein
MRTQSTGGVTTSKAVLATIAFVVITPVVATQLRSEWSQVAIVLLATAAFGYFLGRLLSPRSTRTLFLLGAGIGLLLWVGVLVAAQLFYPGYRMFPATWLIRFGVGGGLVLTATALFGDQAQRQERTLSISVLATAVGIVGGLLTIIKGG